MAVTIPSVNMSENKSVKILKAAEEGVYGVIAVCCYNLEQIVATCRAAEATSSPAMILLFPIALQTFGPILANAAADVCKRARVPISLHLDHCQDIELVKYAATLPFDSIMVDMSHYSKPENLRLTTELTTLCHSYGIATEAEPGRIEGGEDGVKDTAELEGILTSPEEALEFLATGIDFLAPAFGNVHGLYVGDKGPRPHLQFERLEKVREATKGKAALVLHGSGQFDESLYRDCVSRGVTKINVNAQLVEPWAEIMGKRETFAPLTEFMDDSMRIFESEIVKLMEMAGSCGKVLKRKTEKI